MTRRVSSRAAVSRKVPRFRPAIRPTGMPMRISSAHAIMASLMVTGKVSFITSSTGRPVKVSPKSRVTMPRR